MNFFTDTTVDKVRVSSSWGKGILGEVRFGNDPVIPLPQDVPNENIKGYYMKADIIDDKHYAILMSSANLAKDQCTFLVCKETGKVEKKLRAGCGMWGVWINSAHILITDCHPDYYLFNTNGDQLSKNPIPLPDNRTSQGFAGWDLFTDAVGLVTIQDYHLARYRTSGKWGVGLHTASDKDIIAYDSVAEKLYLVAQVKTQVGCTIVEHDDNTCTVSISLPEDAKTFFVTSDQFTPIEKPIPEPSQLIEKYPRLMICAPYDTHNFKNGQIVTTDRFIGNVCFPDYRALSKVPKELPLILGEDTPIEVVKQYDNRTLYYYVHCGGSSINDKRDKFREIQNTWPNKPIIYYYDADNWPSAIPAFLVSNQTFLGAKCYRRVGESVSKLEVRLTKMMNILTAYKLPIVATLMFYDQGIWEEDEIIECVPVYEELIDKYKIIGIMPFSDLRANGMSAHPILYMVLEDMYSKIPGRPNRFSYWDTGSTQDLIQKLKYEMPVFAKSEIDMLTRLIEEDV